MNEEYVRENKIQDKSEEEKRMELLINIIKTKIENKAEIPKMFSIKSC